MRVLVTGHRGYIGTMLVPVLLGEEHVVNGLDTGLFEECTFLDAGWPVMGMRRDLRDVQVEDLRGFDAVVHLAGLSNDALSDLDPDLTESVNYRAAVRLARCARQAGVSRFVFASTCSVYGKAPDGLVDESTPCRPLTAYARSKAMVERDVADLANDGFSPAFLRLATVYGLSPRIRLDLVVNDLAGWAFTSGTIRLRSDGSAWRSLVHVEDVCRAIAATLAAPRADIHAQVINVAVTGESYRVRAIAEAVREAVPGSQIELAPRAGPDERTYRVCCKKMSALLPAFAPRWNLRDGIGQIVGGYKSAALDLETFCSSRFRRLDRIRFLRAEGRIDASLRSVDRGMR
jgi:nucleoside-diphosphate-sugar epimerase